MHASPHHGCDTRRGAAEPHPPKLPPNRSQVKAGALPLLVTLVSCKVPALVRASLSAVACLIGSNAVATQAALKADLMPPLMRIICAARPTAHLPAAPPATALSSQTAAAGLDLTSSAASAAEAAAAAAESDAPVGGPVGGTGSHTARATCVAASAGKGSNSTPDGADGVNVGSRQSSSGAPTAGVSHDVYERAAALLTNVLVSLPTLVVNGVTRHITLETRTHTS